jgi:putative oxidoreductase
MELLVPLGRLLFSAMFIQSGIRHLRQRASMAAYARSMGAPLPDLMVPLTGVMILLGGISVLLGVYARAGAWLLVLFLVPTVSGGSRIQSRCRTSGLTFRRISRWPVPPS